MIDHLQSLLDYPGLADISVKMSESYKSHHRDSTEIVSLETETNTWIGLIGSNCSRC